MAILVAVKIKIPRQFIADAARFGTARAVADGGGAALVARARQIVAHNCAARSGYRSRIRPLPSRSAATKRLTRSRYCQPSPAVAVSSNSKGSFVRGAVKLASLPSAARVKVTSGPASCRHCQDFDGDAAKPQRTDESDGLAMDGLTPGRRRSPHPVPAAGCRRHWPEYNQDRGRSRRAVPPSS